MSKIQKKSINFSLSCVAKMILLASLCAGVIYMTYHFNDYEPAISIAVITFLIATCVLSSFFQFKQFILIIMANCNHEGRTR